MSGKDVVLIYSAINWPIGKTVEWHCDKDWKKKSAVKEK